MAQNERELYLQNEEEVLDVIDVNRIDLLTFHDEADVANMTSLRTFMLLERNNTDNGNSDCIDDDGKLHRLSLAYERMSTIPKLLLEELAHTVQILDISYNEFSNLDFLTEFKQLTTLIGDRNLIKSTTVFPYMPKLELLWLNHCKINSLYPWAKKLQWSCPNLKFLSLMGNPIAPSYLNGGNFYEYLQYRYFIISLFPNLLHLDDRPITEDQRHEAEKMYKTPLVERLVNKTHATLPLYIRQFSDIFDDILNVTNANQFSRQEKNLII